MVSVLIAILYNCIDSLSKYQAEKKTITQVIKWSFEFKLLPCLGEMCEAVNLQFIWHF